jgi:aerobic C4-dicarboxylate transport protein
LNCVWFFDCDARRIFGGYFYLAAVCPILRQMKVVRSLYFQVVVGMLLGIAVGVWWPDVAAQLKPLSDVFIKLVKMLVAPIIFITVVAGIAGVKDKAALGRVGLKTLLYFEVVSTLALVIGLVVVNVLQPGAGMNANLSTLDTSAIAQYTQKAKHESVVQFLLNIVPNTFFEAFANGEILQVLLVAILFGLALSRIDAVSDRITSGMETVLQAFLKMVGIVMRLAPLAAFGAMGFTIGKFGPQSLAKVGQLIACLYITCAAFVFVVLGLIAAAHRISIFKLLHYIRDEILIVLGTSSSESVLPRMMEKMQALGCSRSVVGIVLPTGYSFNLDGTSIYLTLAALFIAQALNIHMPLSAQIGLLAVFLLTSKGAAAITGGGFVTLAATLQTTGSIPVEGLVLVVGIDRIMSEARAITNLIGNAVAMLVIAKWEQQLDLAQAQPLVGLGTRTA